MRRYLLPVFIVLLFDAACSNPSIKALPPPPTTVAPLESAALQDFSGSQWIFAPGHVTSTTQGNVGTSTLNGTVTNTGAPVAGATVVIDHFAGDSTTPNTINVTTGNDGKYIAPNIAGGRYRVRAFRSPDLGLASGQVFFMKNGDTKTVDLSLNVFNGVTLSWAIAPNPPIIQQDANLGILLTQKSVSANGVISSVPVSGVTVTLANASVISLQTAAAQVTNSKGAAQWTVRCSVLSVPSVTFTIDGSAPQIIQLPSCAPVPTTTTSASSSTTTTVKH